MAERAHLSIGEVLSLVQEEFPDITISKIRFLESQGLLDPERTPSGYRKFYESDIERLHWILSQQRDHFLPLKVIRERLAEWDATGRRPEEDGAGRGEEHWDETPPEVPASVLEASPAGVAAGAGDGDGDGTGGASNRGGDTAVVGGDRPTTTGATRTPAGAEAAGTGSHEPTAAPRSAPAAGNRGSDDDVRHAAASLAAATAIEVAPQVSEPPTPAPAAAVPPPAPEAPSATADPRSMTAEEMAERAGVPVAVVHELAGFSMLTSTRVGPETYYDAEQLPIVQACRTFLEHGVEVRHLRMYKIAAEREAGVLEQLIMPMLKQRNPDARARAVATVSELGAAGEVLHAALLRRALRGTLPDVR